MRLLPPFSGNFAYSGTTLKVGAASSSETLTAIYQSKWRSIAKDRILAGDFLSIDTTSRTLGSYACVSEIKAVTMRRACEADIGLRFNEICYRN
jgi:hypothetical protein